MSRRLNIKICTKQEELQDAIKVRESAFVEEYGYSKEELVLYPLDNQALQILATDYSGTPVGSCRFTPLPQDLDNLPPSSTLNPQTENSARELFKDSQGGRFWWLAVSPAGRGRGVAGGLIKYCEEYTAEMVRKHSSTAYMRIRANYKAHKMYLRFGYVVDSEKFLLAGQELIWMKKTWKV
ncbi:hypothetical protein J056_000315 [Wallemia ichthyophaga EXF-994]|uniref:N-acetyltransferase domain-containing protein n=1 Tax=Wallemia ichthyophaga (strain EXF-994 / CBS 113033) TaxID=1299270 RepID=R9ASC9_WALI9|nr:uncharacterized protein J056_000315 [Wallemia ichthyophaga EXF-994]EOR04955.1 hypothetical protein J056_000315 [Wallemia ichthyophaga EXF-994]